ncbi:hypothetical protein CFOL_v3_33223 [Cephalotus follicularis]|uniref:Uncharacterized protein n=1 Tax=Cephalotus follicularis TaxID=3775 RepID=A0A1Q3DBH7_CEPFO|nr:hypothetical protein CFOL_v3_33223 [Cephalotus follicularis]
MDHMVDSLNNAYQEFVATTANVLEAKEVACDQAEEFVESVKQRIGSECLVDEATGSVTWKPGQAGPTGLPPISAVRLEQMSKTVRWLVLQLQNGSGNSAGPAHAHSSTPFDARFTEDAAQ